RRADASHCPGDASGSSTKTSAKQSVVGPFLQPPALSGTICRAIHRALGCAASRHACQSWLRTMKEGKPPRHCRSSAKTACHGSNGGENRRAFLTPALQFLFDLHIAGVSAANIKPLALPPLTSGAERSIAPGNHFSRKRYGLSHCAARHVR